jgi:5-methylcytosine-specific restriction endonuclease McrA
MFDKKAYLKKYAKDNKARINERSRARYAADSKKVLAAKKKWRLANSDRKKAINRAWRLANPARDTATLARRRARKLAQTCGCCAPWSLKFIYAQGRALGMHVDHVKPLAKGGLHCLKNMQLLAPSDNQRKGARYVETQPEVQQ